MNYSCYMGAKHFQFYKHSLARGDISNILRGAKLITIFQVAML